MRDIEQDRDTALEDDIRSLVARRIESHDTFQVDGETYVNAARKIAVDVTPEIIAAVRRHVAQTDKDAEIAALKAEVAFLLPFRYRAEAAEARVAELEAGIARLSRAARMLQQNSEGCAINHYGDDFALFGKPGWLADTEADIAAVDALLNQDKTNG